MKTESFNGSSMENLETHYLDFNLTYPYIADHLEWGNTLAKAILKNCDLSLGTFHTILPTNANFDAIYLFKNGWIIPQEKEKQMIDFYGSKVKYQEITSVREEMIKYVYDFLNKYEATVVLEDAVREKKDNFTKIENVFVSYVNNEVYFILKSKNSQEEISKTIKKAATVWQFVGILIPYDIELSEELTNDQINLLSSSIQCMIVVAYDGESYIFWERNEAL